MTFHGNWEQAGGEERTEYYRTWRTKLGLCCVGDADQIEYRYKAGVLTIVAVIELGVADFGPDKGFLDADNAGSFPARLSEDRPQGAVMRLVAERLGVDFYGVVTVKDRLERFWCWNFTKGTYRVMTQEQYVAWLGSL